MSTNHKGNTQPAIDQEEHTHISNVAGKKVFNIDSAGNVVNFSGVTVYQGDIPWASLGTTTLAANVTVHQGTTPWVSQSTITAYGSGTEPLKQDDATNHLITIDHSHHEVHEGDYYRSGMNFTLSNGQLATYAMITPDTTKWDHVTWNLSATADGTFTVLEDCTLSGGATVYALNHNRNSGATAGTLCLRGMTGNSLVSASAGTTILNATLGTGKGNVIDRGTGAEFILKQNSSYLFRYTNGTSANIVQLAVEWYEHADE